MTPLRQKMIDAMQVRGFAVRTHRTYLDAVSKLAGYYKRSPERLTRDEIQRFFLYLDYGDTLPFTLFVDSHIIHPQKRCQSLQFAHDRLTYRSTGTKTVGFLKGTVIESEPKCIFKAAGMFCSGYQNVMCQ